MVGLVFVQLGLSVASTAGQISRNLRQDHLEEKLFHERIEIARSQNANTEKPGQTWHGFRKFVVDRRVEEADSICSFYLKPHDGKPLPDFHPGQFLTFQLAIPGKNKPVVRCYSLSDAPNINQYRVSIKRVPPPRDRNDLPPGLGSNFFHDHVAEGDILNVKAPGGNFFMQMSSDRPAILIGGGVGITPMLSMLNAIVATKSKRKVWLFYGVRKGSEQVQRDHLRQLDQNHDNVTVVSVYSSPDENEVEGRDFSKQGHVSVDLMKSMLPSNNFEYFICGPPPMMESVTTQLAEWGVPDCDVNSEAFGPASVKAKHVASKEESVAKLSETITAGKIAFSKSDKAFTWDLVCENLLDFAEANGIEIESGCRSGNCGACQVAITSGEVIYEDEPGFEIEEGCCLTCIGRPSGDISLDA